MVVFKHELKAGLRTLLIWAAILAGTLCISVIIFPSMVSQLEALNDTMSSMGDFSKAFGMDVMGMSNLISYYAIEGANTLGIGGALLAAMLGAAAISKEESKHTAEFLLTHPIKRSTVVTQKILAVIVQILIFNAICVVCSLASVAIIGELKGFEFESFFLLHFSFTLLQIEIACICVGVSAFFTRGAVGIGFGIAALFYFMNIIANILDKLDFLKYITPFGYTEASDILTNNSIDILLLAIGACVSAVCLLLAYKKYTSKDIMV